MPDTRQYGQQADGTYAYAMEFMQLPLPRIQKLLFDDTETKATPKTWMTQTTGLVKAMAASLGDKATAVKSIEPTMDPPYSIKVVVEYKYAVDVQNMLKKYITTLPARLYITEKTDTPPPSPAS